jgi:hypothetical protein
LFGMIVFATGFDTVGAGAVGGARELLAQST